MSKIKVAALLLVGVICLCSCGLPKRSEPSFFGGDFVCEYSYTENGAGRRARLISRQTDGESELTLTFLEPKALCGVVCKKKGSSYSLSFGELLIDGASAESLALSARLLCGMSDMRFCGKAARMGEAFELYSAVSEDGRALYVYVDGRTGLPTRIEVGEDDGKISFDIISFEYLGG